VSTPLYKSLKQNGTTFYAFPGATEDISLSFQSDNQKMYFSKFVLLNIPKQITQGNAILNNDPVRLDFEDVFPGPQSSVPSNEIRTLSPSQPGNFKDQLIQSLRNYVANHEVVIKNSKIGPNDYFYDNTQLPTVSEQVFWKWAKK
jgi:hypothetical protein